MKELLFVSFSGGKSSAYMARRLQLEYGEKFTIIFLFANTGQEREETLLFIKQCAENWGMHIVWVEAVFHAGRVATTHRIVTFETASRHGEPFEAMIEKYGLPNKSYPHCTRELKLAPMYDYLNSIGWVTFKVAIGIRADEPRRLRKDAEKAGIVYPLAHWFETDKQDVNDWWLEQSFNLNLKSYEGNCSWCWKKSFIKHFRLIDSVPEIYAFPDRMEKTHALTNSRHGVRVMFRENNTADNLFSMRAEYGVKLPPSEDDDSGDGCSESCDVNEILTAP